MWKSYSKKSSFQLALRYKKKKKPARIEKVLEETDLVEMGSSITVNLLWSTWRNNGSWRRESSWGLCFCTVDETRQIQRDICWMAAGPSVTSWSAVFIGNGRFFLLARLRHSETNDWLLPLWSRITVYRKGDTPIASADAVRVIELNLAATSFQHHVFAEEASKEEAFRS